jgi:hypothetical protein
VSTTSLVSGKSDALRQRKSLNADISELLQQTTMLHEQLSKLINARKALQMAQAAAPSPSSIPASSSTTSDDTPLNREETSKLLLLVSKAAAAEYITQEQKSYIKDEICAQRSHLRSILNAGDIRQSIVALAQVKPGNR